MVFVENYRIGFIGIPKKIKGDDDLKVANLFEFLSLLRESMIYNIGLGINFMCIDTSEFSNVSFLTSPDFNEELYENSELISEMHSLCIKNKFRFCFLVPKDYFIASQLEPVSKETLDLLDGLSFVCDLLGQRGRSIIVRVGSAYGNRKKTLSNFNDIFLSLNQNTQDRVCLINDEKPSLFSVTDLLSGCYYVSGIPIVFRFLSHLFNDGGLSVREAFFLSCSTWKKEETPIIIHSQSDEEDEDGFPVTPRPSRFLTRRIPTFGLRPDILIDSPEKEIACLRYKKESTSLPPIIFNKKKNAN
jgi:UV DNA damage repair endonuclease